MNMKSISAVLLLTAVSMAPSSTSRQDEASFSRTYKEGEKAVYATTYHSNLGGATISADIEITAKKLLEGGRAELLCHMANKVETGTTREAPNPADVTVRTSAHNLPEKFGFTIGSIDFVDLFVLIASMTLDKKVKPGVEEAWSWNGGGEPAPELKGSTKVLEVSTAQGTLVAEIKADWTIGGQHFAAMTLKSTYNLSNGSLKSSAGEIKVTKDPDTIKIVRKS